MATSEPKQFHRQGARAHASSQLVVDAETSRRLARIRQRDTGAEVRVRQLLAAEGLRFRISNRDLPGSPDIANRRRRWAVFVHGCFWHAHPSCSHATVPKRNRAFWVAKFTANRARDAAAVRALRRAGYRVVTIWECQLRGDAHDALHKIARLARAPSEV